MKRIEDIQNTLMVRNSLSDIIYSQTRNNAYSIVSNSLQINNSINQNSFRTNKTQINTNEQISVTCPNLSDARNVNNISSINENERSKIPEKISLKKNLFMKEINEKRNIEENISSLKRFNDGRPNKNLNRYKISHNFNRVNIINLLDYDSKFGYQDRSFISKQKELSNNSMHKDTLIRNEDDDPRKIRTILKILPTRSKKLSFKLKRFKINEKI